MTHWSIDYKIQLTARTAIEPVSLYIAFPQSIPLRQTLISMSFNVETKEVTDDHRNSWLMVNIPAFEQNFTFRYNATIDIHKYSYDLDIFDCDYAGPKEYLKSEPGIECDDPGVLKLAQSIPVSFTILEKLKAAIELVIDKMSYQEQSGEYGAKFAAAGFIGDCTEYASLLAAILRAHNIAARMAVGYLGEELHAITEVYCKGLWIPIDVTNLISFSLDNIRDFIVLMRGNWMLSGGTEKLASFYYRCKSRPTLTSSCVVNRRPKVVILDDTVFYYHKHHTIGGLRLSIKRTSEKYAIVVDNNRNLDFKGVLVCVTQQCLQQIFPVVIRSNQQYSFYYSCDKVIEKWFLLDRNEQIVTEESTQFSS